MRSQGGAVALEAVLLLPLVVLLVAAVLGTTTVVVEHLAVARAARAAARTVALTGEPGAAARVAQGVRPGAVTTVRLRGGVVHVDVAVRGGIAGVPYTAEATAVAPLEPVTVAG